MGKHKQSYARGWKRHAITKNIRLIRQNCNTSICNIHGTEAAANSKKERNCLTSRPRIYPVFKKRRVRDKMGILHKVIDYYKIIRKPNVKFEAFLKGKVIQYENHKFRVIEKLGLFSYKVELI